MSNLTGRFLPVLGVALLASCGGDSKRNTPPTMQAQSFNGAEDSILAGQVTATDANDTLTFAVTTNPANGTLTAFAANGTFTYRPNSNFNGTDTFTATVTDSRGQTATANVTLIVAAVNDAPTATNDVLTLTSASAIDVLANDTDPDNDALTVALVGASFPSGATVGADRRVTFPMAAGFKGFVRFRYRITDAAGATSEADALGFVNVAPFKAVFIGRPSGAAPVEDRIYASNFLATTTADGGATNRIVGMNIAANGRALAYQEEIPLTAPQVRREIFYVDLNQPAQRHPVSGQMAAGLAANRLVQSADGRQLVYELANAGTSSAIYRYDTQAPATPAARISPADTELRFTTAPVLNAAGTFVYYGGRAPANGAAAAYRTSLATGVTTRVSPLGIQTRGVGIDFVLPNPAETRIVVHWLYDGLFPPPDTHDVIYVNDPTSPDVSAMLHIPPPAAVTFDVPLVAPDGLHTLLLGPGGLQSMARTDTPGMETWVGAYPFGVQVETAIPDRQRVMRADSQAALLIGNCPKPNYFLTGACDVFELTFATPATPVRVNSANALNDGASDPAYSADGARILFLDTDNANPNKSFAVVKRGSFGTQASISPAGESVVGYALDASGYVALYTTNVAGQSDKKLVIANVDVPGETLEVGIAGSGDQFLLVAR